MFSSRLENITSAVREARASRNNGAQWKESLKPLGAMLPCCWRGFRGSLNPSVPYCYVLTGLLGALNLTLTMSREFFPVVYRRVGNKKIIIKYIKNPVVLTLNLC